MLFMEDIGSAVAFHGHLCPMFYLGLRMGDHALRGLGRGREAGLKFHAVVEFVNCFSDGIQVVTGATFGKENLHSLDIGKFAASFYDKESDRNLRLSMNKDVLERVLEFGKAGKKVKDMPPHDRAAEAKAHMKRGRELVDWLRTLDDQALFNEGPAPEFASKRSQELDYLFCESCGELTLTEYVEPGKRICRSCLKL